MSNVSGHNGYVEFVLSIKQRILKSQYEALKSVNKELIALYWDIGKSIVEKQDELGWGKSIVKTLAEDLQKEFIGIKGFSVQNLWNMRLFYLEYRDYTKLQTLPREIAWQHNIAIIQKTDDNLEREFYIQMTKLYGWTYRVLTNHIENKSYEKFLLNQTNFDKTVPQKYKDKADFRIKSLVLSIKKEAA
jgi:predicted nuclease of restriction endonuclease-like (RecB) superfamily